MTTVKRKRQLNRIAEWLENGKSITPQVAARKFNTKNLSSAIAKLRQRGYGIATTAIKRRGTQYSSYALYS